MSVSNRTRTARAEAPQCFAWLLAAHHLAGAPSSSGDPTMGDNAWGGEQS